MILEFKNQYRFLSNFEPVEIKVHNISYPSVEHAYMSKKSNDIKWKEFCADPNNSAGDVKKASYNVKLVPDWDVLKFEVMEFCLRQKFSQEPFRTKLIETGNQNIIEGNYHGDVIWGMELEGKVIFEGENHLGRLLMQIRHDITNISHIEKITKFCSKLGDIFKYPYFFNWSFPTNHREQNPDGKISDSSYVIFRVGKYSTENDFFNFELETEIKTVNIEGIDVGEEMIEFSDEEKEEWLSKNKIGRNTNELENDFDSLKLDLPIEKQLFFGGVGEILRFTQFNMGLMEDKGHWDSNDYVIKTWDDVEKHKDQLKAYFNELLEK